MYESFVYFLLQWLLKLQVLSVTAQSLVLTPWFLKLYSITEMSPFPVKPLFLDIFLHDLCSIASGMPHHITQKGVSATDTGKLRELHQIVPWWGIVPPECQSLGDGILSLWMPVKWREERSSSHFYNLSD